MCYNGITKEQRDANERKQIPFSHSEEADGTRMAVVDSKEYRESTPGG